MFTLLSKKESGFKTADLWWPWSGQVEIWIGGHTVTNLSRFVLTLSDSYATLPAQT